MERFHLNKWRKIFYSLKIFFTQLIALQACLPAGLPAGPAERVLRTCLALPCLPAGVAGWPRGASASHVPCLRSRLGMGMGMGTARHGKRSETSIKL
jgi:hypothetical protein